VREHDLKCWPEFFAGVEAGQNPFEVRRDDGRGFAVGDTLLLREWDPETGEYTGRACRRRITYVLRGPRWGIEAGYVVMGLAAEVAA